MEPFVKSSQLPYYSLVIITSLILSSHVITAQRSLHHWKRDLEMRLRHYQDQSNEIKNIIASSYPGRGAPLAGTVVVSSQGNVRFSELIIPIGSLILESHIAKPTVQVLIDKTLSYVGSKLRELDQFKYQLGGIKGQLDSGARQFIYKGSPDVPQPQYNFSGVIHGNRVFKQLQYAQLIDSNSVKLPYINRTDVNRVIDETYLRISKVRGLEDAQGRLFFEGTKTFFNTVFAKPLKSGCCDRLKPLHTSRMMLRSIDQEVLSPIVLRPKNNFNAYGQMPVKIRYLETAQLLNQNFAVGGAPQYPNSLSPVGINYYSPPENIIKLTNLISLHQIDQPKALKTIVFKDVVKINEALLSDSFSDKRFIIGVGSRGPQSIPVNSYDLSHDNYLLKFEKSRNNSYEQLVSGTTILDSFTNFQFGLEAQSVNHIVDFAPFVRDVIVRTDRPAVINGPVVFNTGTVPYGPLVPNQMPPSNMIMLQVQRDLQVGTINGMRLAQDIVVLPSKIGPPNAVELRPGQVIQVYGNRRFTNQLLFSDLVQVSGLVNGMRLPETVIPLHLNDFVNSVGHSDLWFIDGMTVDQLVIQGGRFDDIILRDVYVDAQSLVMHSVFPRQPDGSILILAPLKVKNLHLFGQGLPNRGLINGFRPQELDLSKYDALPGRKTFLAPVQASECIFNDINGIPNWTSQLIRIDRPNTVQNVHSRLAFASPIGVSPSNTSSLSPSVVNIDRLDVEFNPGNNPVHYANNWRFSPEFYLMHQALVRHAAGTNQTGGRYRCKQVRLQRPNAMVNSIVLEDIVTLDKPYKFSKQFTMVGKVDLTQTSLRANRIQSNYPIDKLDLVQFNDQRIPIFGSRTPIRLNNLVFGPDNKASFIHSRLINGVSFTEFANSIMSLTRPQFIDSELVFESPVSFEGPVHTTASLNGIKEFRQFANQLRNARYTFEDGLQCNAVVIRT